MDGGKKDEWRGSFNMKGEERGGGRRGKRGNEGRERRGRGEEEEGKERE